MLAGFYLEKYVTTSQECIIHAVSQMARSDLALWHRK